MPMSFDITSPARLSMSGRVTMARGKSVHFSLRVLGMEVGALYVTSDSLYAIDKFHRRYLAESVGRILGSTKITISDVQDALLGRAFLPSAGPEAAPSLLAGLEAADLFSELDKLGAASPWAGIEALYLLSRSYPAALSGVAVLQTGRQPVVVLYDAPALTPYGPVATAANIQATVAKKPLRIEIKYKPDQARWNEPRTPSVRIPASYQRISAASLLKSLSAQ